MERRSRSFLTHDAVAVDVGPGSSNFIPYDGHIEDWVMDTFRRRQKLFLAG